MAKPRCDIPEWKWDIGQAIRTIRLQKGYKTQEQFAEALENYRTTHYPEYKPFTRNDVDQLENGASAYKVEQVLAICDVLGLSCDEVLRGNKPEDQKIVDEYGLSGKILVALRNDDHAGETLKFFMDNQLIELLYELRRYIELDDKDLEGISGISSADWINYQRYLFVDRLKTWRNTYRLNKKVLLERKAMQEKKEVKVDAAQTGKRGRNSKTKKA